MLNRVIQIAIFIGISLLFFSCDSGPKVIQSKKKDKSVLSESYFEWPSGKATPSKKTSFSEGVHKVKILEQMMAQRYVYLRVAEEGKEFWIATRKQEMVIGDTYYYRAGLLKKDFYSREFDRNFEQIYLVSKLVPEKHGGNQLTNPQPVQIETHSSARSSGLPTKISGSISIAELIKNPSQFEGQIVKLSGKCVKVNPNIMNRNWIHLKDGTADQFDLVITTRDLVNEGDALHVKARVALNKDFGAGYTYDLILEEGELQCL